MLACLTTRERVLLGVVGLVVVITAALEYGGGSDVAVFLVGALALAGVAWVVSFSTEAVGERFGPALTGVLQSTLGNLPELFVVLFALSAGELVVAQYSILGSLFANALLVLGLVILAGSRAAGGTMKFGRRLPNDTATLLLLAVFMISVLGVSDRAGDRASEHQVAISVVGAICLLIVYAAWLVAYLRADKPGDQQPTEAAHSALPFTWAIVLLAVAGVSAALVSDWFVDAIDPAVEKLGISKAFTGLVIVAIAGNAVENVVAIQLARKGQSELALSVVKNSVSQISCFLFPALVLVSLLFTEQLTFVIDPVYVGALALTAIAVWQITGDGEAVPFEGWALVAIYIVLAVLTFYE
jgi:Ca2+:H+ antiporter